jgi:general secretion pathway protein K
MSTKQANNRGSMLVLVLFLAGLLSVFAAVAAMAMRAAQNSSRSFADGLRAEEAARGAIEVAVAQAGGSMARMSGTVITNFGQLQVSVVARNEAGRIDLNMAQPQLLAGLFRQLGVGAEDANLYAARVVDWRDEDDKVEKNGGAERSAYRSQGRVDGPRNGPFVHVAELGLVLGIPVPIVAAAAPYLTVASGLEQINPMFADPPALLAIPGISADQVRNFLVERAKPGAKPQDLIASLGQVAEEFITEEAGKAVRFEAQVRVAPNNERRFEAVVYVVNGDTEPFRILAWDANPPQRLRAVP